MPKKKEEMLIDGEICIKCSKCEKFLPANHIYFNKNKIAAYGCSAACKACESKRRSELWTTEKGRVSRERCKDTIKKYMEENREKRKQQKRLHYDQNKESIRAKSKEYFLKNKDKINEANRLYYQKNKEKVLEYIRNYYKSDIGKYYIKKNTHIRKARKRNAVYTLTKKEWAEALEYFGWKCCYCGADGEITQEHVIPLSKGGGYTKQNIIPCCRSCNSSKQDKDMDMWYKKQTSFLQERLDKIYKWIGYKDGIQQIAL